MRVDIAYLFFAVFIPCRRGRGSEWGTRFRLPPFDIYTECFYSFCCETHLSTFLELFLITVVYIKPISFENDQESDHEWPTSILAPDL